MAGLRVISELALASTTNAAPYCYCWQFKMRSPCPSSPSLPPRVDTYPFSTCPQVAITMVYRYQPRASASIDAGELVADNGKIGDYRYISVETQHSSSIAH